MDTTFRGSVATARTSWAVRISVGGLPPSPNRRIARQKRRRLAQQRAANRVRHTLSRGSTNADYLTARSARDRPNILERMEAGEFDSVKAAAREVGLVPRQVTVPVVPSRASPSRCGRQRHHEPRELAWTRRRGTIGGGHVLAVAVTLSM